MSYEKRESLHCNEELELAFQQALCDMDETISDLLPLLSGAEIRKIATSKETGDVQVVRFSKEDSLHVVVMKLVQLTSNLRTGRLLIDHGFVYEWGVMERLLLETVHDINFLLHAERASSKLKKYLCAFYTEDMDEEGNWQHPDQLVSPGEIRKEVLKNIEKSIHGSEVDPLGADMKAQYDLGSGYIHGRVSPIMRLYDLGRNLFRTNGWDDEEFLALNLKGFYIVASLAYSCSCDIRKEWLQDDKHIANFQKFVEITGMKDYARSGDGMESLH